jgi:hypothetical protein
MYSGAGNDKELVAFPQLTLTENSAESEMGASSFLFVNQEAPTIPAGSWKLRRSNRMAFSSPTAAATKYSHSFHVEFTAMTSL